MSVDETTVSAPVESGLSKVTSFDFGFVPVPDTPVSVSQTPESQSQTPVTVRVKLEPGVEPMEAFPTPGPSTKRTTKAKPGVISTKIKRPTGQKSQPSKSPKTTVKKRAVGAQARPAQSRTMAKVLSKLPVTTPPVSTNSGPETRSKSADRSDQPSEQPGPVSPVSASAVTDVPAEQASTAADPEPMSVEVTETVACSKQPLPSSSDEDV